MDKNILTCALIAGTIQVASAESYNRIAVSYDHTALSHNKEASILQIKEEKMGLNGLGLNYIHGFGMVGNLFVETGASIDFLWGTKNVTESNHDNYTGHCKFKSNNIHIQVPLNLAYRINISKDLSISPYAGIDFKYNLSGKYEGDYHYANKAFNGDPTLSDDMLQPATEPEHNIGGIKYDWERFQMGWHIGVGCNYRHGYVGVQFGTDFIHPYNYNIKSDGFSGHKDRITDTNLKISIGYTL